MPCAVTVLQIGSKCDRRPVRCRCSQGSRGQLYALAIAEAQAGTRAGTLEHVCVIIANEISVKHQNERVHVRISSLFYRICR